MSTGTRLDSYLGLAGLARSRNQAQNLIREGRVLVNEAVERRASRLVDGSESIRIAGEAQLVSRSGEKLLHALREFSIPSLAGKVAVDLGASTGGFTQVLLGVDARLVFSVDVGTDQLASELRSDPRVISLEGTDARQVTRARLHTLARERSPDLSNIDLGLVTIDVSFISLRYLLPVLVEEFSDVPIVALFKPQFEVGREGLGKHGVVKDDDIAKRALAQFASDLRGVGGNLTGATPSPIIGSHGNQEFLLWITLDKSIYRGELSVTAQPDWVDATFRGSTLVGAERREKETSELE